MSIIEIQKKITPILKEYGVKKASVFGSVARGDNNLSSDVDILVELDPDSLDIYEYMQLKDELEQKLGKDVDLLSEGYINKFIEPYIRTELKTIYER